MRRYIAKRVAQAALVLWAAYTLSFVLLSAIPGDSVTNRVNRPDATITPAGAKIMLEYYGLDRPLWEQYVHNVGAALRGDLGYSLSTAKPVTEIIGQALPHTIQLAGAGLAFGILITALVAITANYAPWAWLRTLAGSVPALSASVPIFVIGIVFLQYFSFRLGLIPSVDDGSLRALIAPGATLGIVTAAPLSQVLTASIRSTRRQPFVHVQHAKGAGEAYIFRRDVLRNSSLPVLTLLGLTVGELIAGSVLTEAVFARAGVGQLVVASVNSQDLPVVQGVVLLSTTAYIVVNLAVDLAYPLLDPRILVTSTRRSSSRAQRRDAALTADPAAADGPDPTFPSGAASP